MQYQTPLPNLQYAYIQQSQSQSFYMLLFVISHHKIKVITINSIVLTKTLAAKVVLARVTLNISLCKGLW